MNILEISSSDLPGRIFNGYDLHSALNEEGHNAKQVVLQKASCADTVYGLMDDSIFHAQLQAWEWEHSVSHVIVPYGYKIQKMTAFHDADIVHCHILHNYTVSLFDYPELLGKKGSVWTIHDPWIFTGNCIHPLDCTKWIAGCGECHRLHEDTFDMAEDNTAFMWNLKKNVLQNVNPYIVVASKFMKQYVEKSPITSHFNKIAVIPFGIDAEKYDIKSKDEYKRKLSIKESKIVIGFRADDFFIKGCNYLYEALLQLEDKDSVTLICVGNGRVPAPIKEKFNLIELGWVNDVVKMKDFWGAVDVFVMPSLAEGFGVMAIEAMAASCAVICFEGTAVAENTEAPVCGIQVKYKSSTSLFFAIQSLLRNVNEIKCRGDRGRELVRKKYRFTDYVRHHIELYDAIYKYSRCGR